MNTADTHTLLEEKDTDVDVDVDGDVDGGVVAVKECDGSGKRSQPQTPTEENVVEVKTVPLWPR